jgi:hypothetical protein
LHQAELDQPVHERRALRHAGAGGELGSGQGLRFRRQPGRQQCAVQGKGRLAGVRRSRGQRPLDHRQRITLGEHLAHQQEASHVLPAVVARAPDQPWGRQQPARGVGAQISHRDPDTRGERVDRQLAVLVLVRSFRVRDHRHLLAVVTPTVIRSFMYQLSMSR